MDITKQRVNGRNQQEEQNKGEIIFGTTCVTERQENKVVFINSKMINLEDIWLKA